MEKNAIFYKENLRANIVIIFILFVFTASSLLISLNLELSFDEAYYWIYSQNLSFGYYDHPPMVAWSIALGNFIFGHSEFAVRSIFLIYLFSTVLLVYQEIKDRAKIHIYLGMLISMPLVGLTGLFALPDAPLMFFSTLFFIWLRRYIKADTLLNASILALAITGMFYSKYHGLLIVILSTVSFPSFLKRKTFWFIVLLVLALFFPHMYWQYKHDFISFKFHLSGRVEKHFDIKNILDYLLGQFFLMGFLIFPIFISQLKKLNLKDPYTRILLANSFGFLIFLFFMSFRNQIEANWTISCSIAFILLFVDFVSEKKKMFYWGVGLNVIFFILMRIALTFPGWFAGIGKDNRLNEIYHWDKKIKEVQEICQNKFIVGDNYQVTAKIAFYLNDPKIPALHFGSRESQYSLLHLEKNLMPDDEICYLTSKNILNAIKVETNYKDPVYVIPKIRFSDLLNFYKVSYEEVVGK